MIVRRGGLDDPKGIAFFQNWLYVADKTKVLRIDVSAKTPKAEVYVDTAKFPVAPKFLNDIAVDPESGIVFVSDSGHNRVREISGGTITTIAGNGGCCYDGDGGPAGSAQLNLPGGLLVDSSGRVFVADTAAKTVIECG